MEEDGMIIDEQGRKVTNPDLDEGKLVDMTVQATYSWRVDTAEQSHMETVAEYPNGGKDIRKVIDVAEVGHWIMKVGGEEKDWDFSIPDTHPHEQSFTEPYGYQLYKLFTAAEKAAHEAEKAQKAIAAEVAQLKANLSATDYIACKIAEGAATAEEYATEIAQRQAWRDRINELEN